MPTVELREINNGNRDAGPALRIAPRQEGFVSSVADSIAEAGRHPEGSPWYRAVYAGDEPIAFVMLSGKVSPQPPDINGPWFLWKQIAAYRETLTCRAEMLVQRHPLSCRSCEHLPPSYCNAMCSAAKKSPRSSPASKEKAAVPPKLSLRSRPRRRRSARHARRMSRGAAVTCPSRRPI
jgi:hypothetical protein